MTDDCWIVLTPSERASPVSRGNNRHCRTVNYKKKQVRDFPSVTVLASFPGRIVMAEQFEELGLLATRKLGGPRRPFEFSRSTGSRTWRDDDNL
jgi:hypothetical protein